MKPQKKSYMFLISIIVGVLLTSVFFGSFLIFSYFFQSSSTVSLPLDFTETPIVETLAEQLDLDAESPKPTVTPVEEFTLLVTGDVLLARSVNSRMVRDNNFLWAWEHVADELRSADLTYINLETPLVSNCPPRIDGMFFCGDLRNIEGLQFAGVDIINLANNHMGNWQQEGVDETVSVLTENGFKLTGVEQPLYIEQGDTKLAFLGFNDIDRQVGVIHADNETVATQIREAGTNADIVIVQFHWGPEYQRAPHIRQTELAHLAIDSGADLVLGNHPHWWQPYEMYKDKLIVYSHGNFIFDQMWSYETREGIVGKYTFENKKLKGFEFLPMVIYEYGQPKWMEGEEREKFLMSSF